MKIPELSYQSDCCCCCLVTSVVSNSMRPHRRQPTRLPRPWDSPGKNSGVCCHFLLQCMKVKSESEVAQSCPTLSNPMHCSLPRSSVHGIFQAGVLEWGAIAFYFPPNSVSMFLFGTGEHRLSFSNKSRCRPGTSHSRQFQGKTRFPRSLLSPSR